MSTPPSDDQPPAPGSAVALDALLTHRRFVDDLARRLVRDESTADDVAQRTWLAALRSPPADLQKPRSWLARVVRNLVHEQAREAGRRRHREELVARSEATPDATTTVARADAFKRLVVAVMELDEPFRTTVLLRFFDDLPPREVAARQCVPVETVRSRLRRAVARLRERMDDESGGRRAWAALLVPGWVAPLAGPHMGRPEPMTTGGLVAGGGLAVAKTKTTALLVSGLVLLLAGGVALYRTLEESPTVTTGSTEQRAVVMTQEELARARSSPRASETPRADEPARADETATALPDPVDLSAVDRDRDLHGRVVDSAGAGVAGAHVTSWHRPWAESEHAFRGHEVEEAGPTTRTARDGTFKLRLEPGTIVWLRVRADAHPERVLPVRAAGERTDIVLSDGITLGVTVRDADGAPVAGLAVHVTRRYVGDEVLSRRVPTDAQGLAEVAGLPPGLELYVSAHPDNRGRLEMTRVTLPESGRVAIDLVARDARSVAGRVVSAADGSPIPDAIVGWSPFLRGAVITANDGRFVLPGWNGREKDTVHAVAPGFVQRATTAGAGNDLLLRLAPAAPISGRVVDETGAPIEGARVTVYGLPATSDAPETSQGWAITSADGRFRVDGVSAAIPNALVVEARGHARLRRKFDAGSGDIGSGDVGSGDVGDVTLGAARRVEGRVFVDGAGPVTRAEISLVPSDQLHQGTTWFVGRMVRYSDDLGRYRFHDVAPGTYLLAVMRDGYPRIAQTIEVPADADLLDADLEFPVLRPVTVRVTTAGGTAVPGVWIMARVLGMSPTSDRTDADGRAVVHVPTDKDVTLQAYPRGADSKAFVPPPPLKIAPDDTHAEIEFAAASPVTGQVVDEAGEPIAWALVEVSQTGQPTRTLTTGEDGTFAAATTPSGLITLRFTGLVRVASGDRDTGLRAELTGVAPGTTDVVLRADRTNAPAEDRSLTVRVNDPDGNPAEGATVVVSAEGRPGMRSLTTDADGRAVLDAAPDVTHTLQAMIRGDWYASQPVTARPGDGEVVLNYRAALVIEGEAVTSTGERVTEGEARAMRAGRLLCGNALNADGTFRLIIPVDETDGVSIDVVVTEGSKTERGTATWEPGTRPRVVINAE